jgi:glycosyltransferase involved in cell wall biosynthesis
MHYRLIGVFPIHNSGGWNAHTCVSLCEHMLAAELSVELLAPSSDPRGRRSFTRDAVPRWLKGVVYRLDSKGDIARVMLRRRFRRALGGADVVYFWAGVHEDFYADVRAAGVPLCIERINCHRETARPILEEAYRRMGIAPATGISDADIAEERRKLAAADWIFAPSPMVHRSLLDAGVPAAKILASSYGCSPERVAAVPHAPYSSAPLTVLFVGNFILRKGIHLLLDAWSGAGIDGRLVLCGPVYPEVRKIAGHHFARSDVVMRGYVNDLAPSFAESDIFAFPTLEEGSPLVIYEAMAHGLAILTTPAGSGGVVRDGIEGLVLDPYDRLGWIAALKRLASDRGLRARLGAAARERAYEFTWAKVGARRREMLLAALAARRISARPDGGDD